MSGLYQDKRNFVLKHGAINNPYLIRFQTGELSDPELQDFAIEFYSFARFFPKILVSQLVNTEDEAIAEELTRVLYSELGDGNPEHRHELLYRRFLTSVGISIQEALTRPMMPSTKAYIEGMEMLYSSGNHEQALGASFGLENMAITMWDHLLPGLLVLKRSRHPHMDMEYFTFHRELESTHEDAMEKAVSAMEDHSSSHGALSADEETNFSHGVKKVLDYLEGFWMGLERNRETIISNPSPTQMGVATGGGA
ncbi:MAG: TenA family transcriptional regulator [Nitrospirales bacterium]